MISREFLSKIAIAAGLSLTLSAGAFAQQQQSTAPQEPGNGMHGRGMHGDRGGRDGGRMMQFLESLNLTDAQKQQVHTIIHQSEESTRPQREEMRQLMMQSRQGTLSADDQTKLSQLRDQLRAANKKMHEEIVAVLTPDQQTKLKQAEEEWRAKRPAGGPRENNQQ
jgi:Spy/CpxP family protein refolding chaperone